MDLHTRNPLLLRVFAKPPLLERALKRRRHRCPVQDTLAAITPILAILKTEHTRKLMSEPGNREIVAFGTLGHGIVMRIMPHALVISSKNRWTVKTPINAPSCHNPLVRQHSGKRVVQRLHGVLISVKQIRKKIERLARMLVKSIWIIPVVTQTRTDIDPPRTAITYLARIVEQTALVKPLDKCRTVIRRKRATHDDSGNLARHHRIERPRNLRENLINRALDRGPDRCLRHRDFSFHSYTELKGSEIAATFSSSNSIPSPGPSGTIT